MTEKECVDFEEILAKCPFCKSSDISPTPLPVSKNDAEE